MSVTESSLRSLKLGLGDKTWSHGDQIFHLDSKIALRSYTGESFTADQYNTLPQQPTTRQPSSLFENYRIGGAPTKRLMEIFLSFQRVCTCF